MKLSKATIDQMSPVQLRMTLYKVEYQRCQAWKKYYDLLKQVKPNEKSSEGETSEEDDDEDEPLINLLQNRPTLPEATTPSDKNGKPKKWCEVCQKHISRDNFATHVKTTKKHQT